MEPPDLKEMERSAIELMSLHRQRLETERVLAPILGQELAAKCGAFFPLVQWGQRGIDEEMSVYFDDSPSMTPHWVMEIMLPLLMKGRGTVGGRTRTG